MEWSNTFINIANSFALHSSCVKRKVGAILVKNKRILSTGYNGTPSGFCNCNECFKNGSLNGELNGYPITHHDFSEKYEIHAEQNCIAFAAKNGVSTDGCDIYITTAPCAQCAKLIIASGIKKVYFKDIYKNNLGLELLKMNGVDYEQA